MNAQSETQDAAAIQTDAAANTSPTKSRPHRRRKWSAFARRVVERSRNSQLIGWAAQAAFFFTLAFFPLLYCLLLAIGFISDDRAELRALLLNYLATLMPGSAYTLIENTLQQMARRRNAGGLSLGLLAALWVAASGMSGLMRALNATFERTEPRGWFYERGKSLLLTLGLGAFIIFALFGLLYGGAFLADAVRLLNFNESFAAILRAIKYPFVIALVLLVFDALYYFAPNLKQRRWQWWSLGAIVGVAIWIAASWGLSLYLGYLARVRAAYGHFGSVIGLMLWWYLTSIAILVGAEINAEIAANRKTFSGAKSV